MSRTIPRAYVTAAWSKNRVDAEDQARKYCKELVKAGYLPLCPVLAFSGITNKNTDNGEIQTNHEEVLEAANVIGPKIITILREVLPYL